MQERERTYQLDPENPVYELLRRILRLTAFPWLVVVIILLLTGTVQPIPAVMLVGVAIIDYAVIPAALRRFPGQVTIGAAGLTTAGKRGSITIPWTDIDLIEVRSGGDQTFRWLYDLLRVDPLREFVYVGVKADSETQRKARSMKNLTIYVVQPRRFVDQAEAFGAQV